MFRNASILRAINPYILFVTEHKANPTLKGLSFSKRAKRLSKMYKDLPKAKRDDLVRRAARRPAFSMNPKKIRTLNFNDYAEANRMSVKALPLNKQRTALTQMFNLKKPVIISFKKGGKGTVFPCKNLEQTVRNTLKKYEQKPSKRATVSHSTEAVKGKAHVSSASAKVKSLMMNKKKQIVKNNVKKPELNFRKHATVSHSTKAVKGKAHVSSASAKVKSLMMKKKKSGHK